MTHKIAISTHVLQLKCWTILKPCYNEDLNGINYQWIQGVLICIEWICNCIFHHQTINYIMWFSRTKKSYLILPNISEAILVYPRSRHMLNLGGSQGCEVWHLTTNLVVQTSEACSQSQRVFDVFSVLVIACFKRQHWQLLMQLALEFEGGRINLGTIRAGLV